MDDITKVQKAAEIFTITGEAMTKISELIMQLNPQVEAPPGSKWTEEEIELLRKAVNQFGTDVQKISEIVKTRSATQLKNALKRKIYATDSNQQQQGGGGGGGQSVPKTEMQSTIGTTIAQATITTPTTIAQQQQQHQQSLKQATIKYEPVETLTTETVPFGDYHHSTTIATSDEPPSKKACPETVGHTDPLLDVENLDDSNSSFKKLDNFISSRPSVESRTVGGVNELAVSNPPLVPPLDIHSDAT